MRSTSVCAVPSSPRVTACAIQGDWGIVSLSCEYAYDARHPDEIAFSANGVTFRDGTSRPTYDLVLRPANLMLELDDPFNGLIKLSSGPLRFALSNLGQ